MQWPGAKSNAPFVVGSLLQNPWRAEQLLYVVEPNEWAIRAVGASIAGQLTQQGLLTAAITASAWGLKKKIIHFGSLHTILKNGKPRRLATTNRYALTVFHLLPGRSNTTWLLSLAKHLGVLHTASQLTRTALIANGVPENLIRVIPLGVDLTVYKPALPETKASLRRRLNIPPEAFVVGSFQKDGIGWGDGLQPKLEKGPDIFVATVAAVAKQQLVHVVLVGPARGYVERALQERGIAITNIGHFKSATAVAAYYAALDAYLISARIEGGPLMLLEAWAAGVPVVSTRVGMVPDVAADDKTALLADVEDVPMLTQQLSRLLNNRDQRHSLVTAARQEVQQYDWAKISHRYWSELYQPLLTTL